VFQDGTLETTRESASGCGESQAAGTHCQRVLQNAVRALTHAPTESPSLNTPHQPSLSRGPGPLKPTPFHGGDAPHRFEEVACGESVADRHPRITRTSSRNKDPAAQALAGPQKIRRQCCIDVQILGAHSSSQRLSFWQFQGLLSLSFQSSFHLSLTVLVRYRSLAHI